MDTFSAKSALFRAFLLADQEIGDPGGKLCAALGFLHTRFRSSAWVVRSLNGKQPLSQRRDGEDGEKEFS
ncbi:MAG: hypothetical protein EA402_01570 [Planctomycetota bacterium]|nr:MAG: hypothetical protein EA402_01570 [Planctomycetota bacterium]